MPLRKELLDICQKIQNEYDSKRLHHLLDELRRVLDEEQEAVTRSHSPSPEGEVEELPNG